MGRARGAGGSPELDLVHQRTRLERAVQSGDTRGWPTVQWLMPDMIDISNKNEQTYLLLLFGELLFPRPVRLRHYGEVRPIQRL